MKNGRNKAKLAVIISMVIWGTIGVFVKSIPLGSGEVALYRGVLALIFIGVYLLIKGEKTDRSALKKELPLLGLSGVALGINWILLFQAYQYTSVSIATLSYYFAPVLVTLISALLYREKLSGKQILCFILSTMGLVFIIGISGMGESGTDGIGIWFGLGAACLYATVVLLNKGIKEIAGLQKTFWQFCAAVIVMIPYVIFSEGIHLSALSPLGIGNLLILGLIHTGIAYWLYFTNLRELKGQEVSILSYIDPLVAVLCSFFILAEPFTFAQAVGGILIIGGALWNEWA